jgi:Flp pilus assembly pilin Flp
MGTIISQLKKLHRDERGAEGLEKLLIVAAIVLPLLGLLIWFRDELKDWVKGLWDTAKNKAEQNKSDYNLN